ncbi:hypothetical protein L596_014899 [Steinernema carpocapsae]|uniref:Uncharacterized protein n=1 Tax=Steinernema carpocapsae TaxID=34508 RepID=A0A4U5NDK2_STECR|nr:hypothetical protein L596_014899 [Steinernema carpocapsae]
MCGGFPAAPSPRAAKLPGEDNCLRLALDGRFRGDLGLRKMLDLRAVINGHKRDLPRVVPEMIDQEDKGNLSAHLSAVPLCLYLAMDTCTPAMLQLG